MNSTITVCKLLTASALLGSFLAGCGDAGNTDITSGVYIGASVSLSPTLVYSGGVIVSTDGTGSTPFTNATVTMNGAILTYDPTYKYYTNSSVVPDPSGNVKLVVTLNGTTYTTTATVYTAPPVLTVQNPFTAANPNSISWSAPAGAPVNNMSYSFMLADQTTSAPVYTPNPVTALNIIIPAGTTKQNQAYIAELSGFRSGAQIANTVTGSGLGMFVNAQPVTFTAQ